MANKHIGTDFDDFLEKEGILAETEAVALKTIFAWEMKKALKKTSLQGPSCQKNENQQSGLRSDS